MFWCPWRRLCELSTIMCKQWERICMKLAFPRYCHGELVYVHKIWLAVSTTLCHSDTEQCKMDLSWNVLHEIGLSSLLSWRIGVCTPNMVGGEYDTLIFWHWTMQNELVTKCFSALGDDFVSYQRLGLCVSNESEFAWNWSFLAIVMENWCMYAKYGWRWVQNFAILTLNNAKWTCHEMFWCPWRRFCELSTIMCQQWERICMKLAFPRYCDRELVYVHKMCLAVITTLCHCNTKQCKTNLSWTVWVPMATILWVINDYV